MGQKCSNKIGVKKLGPKKFWAQNKFWGKKSVLSQKVLSSKNVKIVFGQKYLGSLKTKLDQIELLWGQHQLTSCYCSFRVVFTVANNAVYI